MKRRRLGINMEGMSEFYFSFSKRIKRGKRVANGFFGGTTIGMMERRMRMMTRMRTMMMMMMKTTMMMKRTTRKMKKKKRDWINSFLMVRPSSLLLSPMRNRRTNSSARHS